MPRVLSVFIPALFSLLFPVDNALSQLRTCDLRITTAAGKNIRVMAEIADTEFRRMKGLMFRESMQENRGMLFVFEHEQHLSFWMKNTYIPLSIAYIDRRGVIMEIHDMKPLDTSITYPSKNPAKYALEVNQGWFRKHAINAGKQASDEWMHR